MIFNYVFLESSKVGVFCLKTLNVDILRKGNNVNLTDPRLLLFLYEGVL